MDNVKETNIKVWIFGLLLSVLFVATIIWLSLESVHGSDDPADITRKIYIFCGAILLLILFIVFGWRSEKSRIRDFEKKIQAELGLKSISKMELFTKYINRDRFYGPMEWPRGCIEHEHRFHGEYKGYEICILEPFPTPHGYRWDTRKYPLTAAVHIKSKSFHFPKFTIKNKWFSKYFVMGDQKAQMWFARPHILNFFNQSHRLAAQGNGNEFIFHEIDGEKGNYKLLIEHAFIVLELLSKTAPFSRFSEIGKLQEKCKRDYIRKLVEWPCLLIAIVATVMFVYLLLYK
jgi:hypothetical protein